MYPTGPNANGLNIAVIAKYEFYAKDIIQLLGEDKVHVFYSDSLEDLNKQLGTDFHFDLIFFPHYSEIVPSDLLRRFKCIGFHTGDLPKDRGGSPIQNKIIRGEYRTKVSALLISENLDAGDILTEREINLESGNIENILSKVSQLIADMIREIIEVGPKPRPQIGTSEYIKRIPEEFSQIKLDELTLREIYDRVRMVDGLNYPKAFVETRKYRIELSHASFLNNALELKCAIKEL